MLTIKVCTRDVKHALAFVMPDWNVLGQRDKRFQLAEDIYGDSFEQASEYFFQVEGWAGEAHPSDACVESPQERLRFVRRGGYGLLDGETALADILGGVYYSKLGAD